MSKKLQNIEARDHGQRRYGIMIFYSPLYLAFSLFRSQYISLDFYSMNPEILSLGISSLF